MPLYNRWMSPSRPQKQSDGRITTLNLWVYMVELVGFFSNIKSNHLCRIFKVINQTKPIELGFFNLGFFFEFFCFFLDFRKYSYKHIIYMYFKYFFIPTKVQQSKVFLKNITETMI